MMVFCTRHHQPGEFKSRYLKRATAWQWPKTKRQLPPRLANGCLYAKLLSPESPHLYDLQIRLYDGENLLDEVDPTLVCEEQNCAPDNFYSTEPGRTSR